MLSGLTVAGQLPQPLTGSATVAVQQAFLDGVTAGSWVCAAAALGGAVAVLAFLPARHREPAVAPAEVLAAA